MKTVDSLRKDMERGRVMSGGDVVDEMEDNVQRPATVASSTPPSCGLFESTEVKKSHGLLFDAEHITEEWT